MLLFFVVAVIAYLSTVVKTGMVLSYKLICNHSKMPRYNYLVGYYVKNYSYK